MFYFKKRGWRQYVEDEPKEIPEFSKNELKWKRWHLKASIFDPIGSLANAFLYLALFLILFVFHYWVEMGRLPDFMTNNHTIILEDLDAMEEDNEDD